WFRSQSLLCLCSPMYMDWLSNVICIALICNLVAQMTSFTWCLPWLARGCLAGSGPHWSVSTTWCKSLKVAWELTG
ncbi:MAG: hypothetical protein ACKPKO_40595, partial [Candidatus Fonsibacter sp.]